MVNGLALVDERGIARDHVEPAQLRQRGDDVLADAFGKIFLLRLAAHDWRTAARRSRGDRAPEVPVRAARRRARCVGRIAVRFAAGSLRLHLADKAKTFSRDGADQLLILAAVADRLARGVDPARQRRLGDDAAVPDRRRSDRPC